MRFAPVSVPVLLAAGLAAASAGGCASTAEPPAPHVAAALTPSQQYPIETAPVADEILLAPHGWLSPAQTAALADLAARWREAGEGPIVILGSAEGAGAASARAAAQALQSYGVPAEATQVGVAAGAADPGVTPSPVKVGFVRLAAVVPDCASRWDDLTRTGRNQTPAGFGCATSANLAAQIADPRDLTRPRASTPADGDRRTTVMTKYRAGQSTATERSDDERGAVSDSIQ